MAAPSFFTDRTTIASGTSESDIVALTNGHFAILYEQRITPGNTVDLNLQFYDAAGSPQLDKSLVFATNYIDEAYVVGRSAVALTGGGLAVIWATPSEFFEPSLLHVSVVSSSGQLINTQIVVDTTGEDPLYFDWHLTATQDGGFMITWDSFDPITFESNIFGQLFDSDGLAASDVFSVGAPGDSPAVVTQLTNGNFVFGMMINATGDIKLEMRDTTGALLPVAIDSVTSENTFAIVTDIKALANGGFVIVYSDDSPGIGGTHNVYFRIYNSAGEATFTEFVDSTTGPGNIFPNVLILDDGDIFITYEGRLGPYNEPGGDRVLFGARYNSNGTADGDRITIAGDGVGTVNSKTTSLMADGRILVSWEEEGSTHYRVLEPREAGIIRSGDNGDQQWVGTAFSDQLFGFGGDDRLEGGAGVDLLSGGEGSDVLIGGAGADTLNGGDGFDRAEYTYSNTGVRINLQSGVGLDGDAQGDQLTGIEWIFGSQFNDSIVGSNTAGDTLFGDGGEDVLQGQGGDDALIGGDGNDTLKGGAGDDQLAGQGGIDILNGGEGNDTLNLTDATDDVTVNLNTGVATGPGVGGDTLISIERIQGSNYNDDLTGTNTGGDLLFGANGDDRLEGLGGNDLLLGSNGDDDLRGGAGADQLVGGDGDDVLSGGLGADSLEGGDGEDSVDYSSSTGGVSINLITGVGANFYAAGDTLQSIERVRGSEYNDLLSGLDTADDKLEGGGGADNVQGQGGDDFLWGDNGNDQLKGGQGNDFLVGGLGADILNGGVGYDIVSYEESNAGVSVNIDGAGTGGHAQGDTYLGVEEVAGSAFNNSISGSNTLADTFLGREGADLLQGQAGADYLYGNEGNDVLRGGQGNDTLIGNEDNDTLNGGVGADILVGDEGFDVADYSNATGVGVSINLEAGIGQGGHAQGDILEGIESVLGSALADRLTGSNTLGDELRGGAGNDILQGQGGNDYLDGGADADQLKGGEGDDYLIGGTGGDKLLGGNGFDTVDYSASNAGVAANLDSGLASGGHAQGDTLTGIELVVGSSFNDSLSGSNTLADNLVGGDGNDLLQGQGGNDVLNGGNGADTLKGGLGADTYIFTTAFGAGNVDTIVGYSVVDDTIWLDDSIVSTIAAGSLSAGSFVNGAAALDSDDYIVYDGATGALYYDADGNGAGSQVQFASLTAGLALSNNDFVVF